MAPTDVPDEWEAFMSPLWDAMRAIGRASEVTPQIRAAARLVAPGTVSDATLIAVDLAVAMCNVIDLAAVQIVRGAKAAGLPAVVSDGG